MATSEFELVRVGLCARCRHSIQVPSSRGTIFWRCVLADRDPGFRKYPPLPVARCLGFQTRDDVSSAAEPQTPEEE